MLSEKCWFCPDFSDEALPMEPNQCLKLILLVLLLSEIGCFSESVIYLSTMANMDYAKFFLVKRNTCLDYLLLF